MLQCPEHGEVITDLHFKDQRFIDTFKLVVSASGEQAECLCPVCLVPLYSYLEGKKDKHFRVSTPEERANPDVELFGLEDAVYPFQETQNGRVVLRDLEDAGMNPKINLHGPAQTKKLVRFRLVKGENGTFGRIETYWDDPFEDPLTGVRDIPSEGQRVQDPDRYKIPGVGSLNGSEYGEAMKAAILDAALRQAETGQDIQAEDLI